jgi:hypothetical protein
MLASWFPESRKLVAQSRKPFSAFRQPGVQEQRSHETGSPNSQNREIINSEIPKRRPWSRVDFGIPGSGRLKDQEPSTVGIAKL